MATTFPCPDCEVHARSESGRLRHRKSVHGYMPEVKVCSKCQRELPIDRFGLMSNGRRRGECGACRTRMGKRRKPWTPEDLEKQRLHDRKSSIKKYFGISVEEYEETVARLREEQGDKCAICGSPDPRHRKDNRNGWCLDHDHETNQLRGLLCGPCNMGLGNFMDSVENLEAALNYLKFYKAATQVDGPDTAKEQS